MQPLRPGQVEGCDDPGPPLPRRDKVDVVGSLRLQVQKDLGQALYGDLPAQPLGADGVVLAEAALEGAAGEKHRAAAPGAADAGLLPEVQGSAGRFQGAARPAEACLPGGPVGFALPGACLLYTSLWSWEEARDFCTECLPYVDVLLGIEPYHLWKDDNDHSTVSYTHLRNQSITR